ncbi:MBL fold metallo-hydrolase [Nocardia sp. CA-290969]|uniref:MBL fold metallo-hydrolase n=1 Tax=Nocardia sp. CA-290969 TaxID=3239986 RepID=UPI003D923489
MSTETTPHTDPAQPATTVRQLLPDLWETREFIVPGGPRTHAYLWTPPSGHNILFYSPGDDQDFDRLDQLGGVTRQYLSHQDEAGPMLRAVAEHFGSRLHAPAAESEPIGAYTRIDVLLTERSVDDAGVEVIPTPGHSPGSTSYVASGQGGRTYLFTGDTLLRYADGVWRTGYIPGYSDKDGLRAALDSYATVTPDFVISSAFVDGAGGVHRVEPGAWQGHLEQARAGLS